MARQWMMVAALVAAGLGQTHGAAAQASAGGTVALETPVDSTASSPRPKPRPGTDPAVTDTASTDPATPDSATIDSATIDSATTDSATTDSGTTDPGTTDPGPAKPARDPSKGAVTNLPIPRYVSLKGNEGNARRGPSLTHRIDWVFTTSGMPLRITAEHENWRRVEDAEGMGGWVHYSLLSGVRSILVTAKLADFHDTPDLRAGVAFQAEAGVIGRLLECLPDWCRVNIQGEKGWVQKEAVWGVDAGEVVE